MLSKDGKSIGVEPMEDVQWGTHSCYFYQTKKDLLALLIPYFKLGLRNNDYCLWIVSSDLHKEEVVEAMKSNMNDFEDYLNKGQIEIIPHTDWYLKNGKFNPGNVSRSYMKIHKSALKKGYQSIRCSGDLRWLKRKDLENYIKYEMRFHDSIGNFKLVALCTYPINKFKKAEIINISKAHRYVIFKKNGGYEIIESSEQKQLEDEIQKISLLSSGVAHDFNNLLTIIKGNADMALLLMKEDKKNPIYEHLLEIQESIKSAKPLIQQLYNISRKQSEEAQIVKNIKVNRVIIKLLEMLVLFFQKNEDVQYETELSLDPELWIIKGDSVKIEQSILNLIMNAKDAMPQGGRIMITTSNVKDPEKRKGDYICISIMDTGVGMEHDIIEHIFDPFFTTKGPKGTGLGLSLVKQTTEEFKGWVEVSSEKNKGTTFKIFLPALLQE